MIVPPPVALAATLAARDHLGVIGYRVTRKSNLAAGPYHRRDDVALAVIFQNDRLIGIRVLHDNIDGRPASDAQKDALIKQLTAKNPHAVAVPFDARHFNEYHYSAHGARVKFTSTVNDVNHADGFFDVGPNGAVKYIAYVPRKLPRFATDGLVREIRAPVLPNFWATVKSAESYDGRYLLFRGHGEFVTVNSDFHRFATVDSAKRWLQAER